MPSTDSDFRRPPGPSTPMPFGVDPETLERLLALRDEYGDIASFEKPSGRLAYFINDPVEIRRILVRRHTRYVKGPGFERVKMLLGNGLIVSDGDVWRRSRTMIQPAFKVQNVHRLMGVMMECADRCAATWGAAAQAGDSVNITQETSDFALELILKSIFGDDYENKLLVRGDNPFSFLSQDSTRDLSVVLKVRALRELLLEIVEERRAEKSEAFDFLSMYMDATDRQGQPFTDRELLDELMTLIVAGFETSANTLNWVWYLLADYPDVVDRTLAEIEACMPDRESVNAENATNMRYTQQVLEETLRLYPPVWLFSRRAREDDELEDYDIRDGTDIYLAPYILHRTERYWPDPERFDPDRFELTDAPKKDRPYLPFSLGPRRCLGEYFSFLEMKVHLAMLLPRFVMSRVSDEDPGLELAINLRCKQDIRLEPSLRR